MNDAVTNPHDDAVAAASLVAVAAHDLGGLVLAGLGGPGRDSIARFLEAELADGQAIRVPPGVAPDALLGGLDLAATLAAGRPILQPGLLSRANAGLVVVPMAERADQSCVAAIANALDTGVVDVQRDGLATRCAAKFAVLACDESLADDAPPAAALVDRLAFRVDAAFLEPALLADRWPDHAAVAAARTRYRSVALPDEPLRLLVTAAAAFGIDSPRAVLLASFAARAYAALAGRDVVSDDDASHAARLVYASRVRMLPPDLASDSTPPPPDETDASGDERGADDGSDQPLSDQVLEAIAAAIPAALLARLERRGAVRGGARGRGDQQTRSHSRGRPAGTEHFRRGSGQRLHVLSTLRAAAPWQRLRGADKRLEIRSADLRASRRLAPTRSTTIFAVDASGSAAVQRLAEVKGAIELLLAECYVRRDEVALIVFRGEAPECLLPPTRSLARVKRELAALPGGGGTPLASALDMAATMARAVQRDDKRALVVVMTDGRGNVGRDGTPGHPDAADHALDAARGLADVGAATLIIDTGRRPRDACRELAAAADADYLPLPYADAQSVAAAIRSTGASRAA
ncbi:MAG: magnesium chelatase subunit D [Pseudomonadota bacterium]